MSLRSSWEQDSRVYGVFFLTLFFMFQSVNHTQSTTVWRVGPVGFIILPWVPSSVVTDVSDGSCILREAYFPPLPCAGMMPNRNGRVWLEEFGKLDNIIRGLRFFGISYLLCLISLMPYPFYISHLYIVSDLFDLNLYITVACFGLNMGMGCILGDSYIGSAYTWTF